MCLFVCVLFCSLPAWSVAINLSRCVALHETNLLSVSTGSRNIRTLPLFFLACTHVWWTVLVRTFHWDHCYSTHKVKTEPDENVAPAQVMILDDCVADCNGRKHPIWLFPAVLLLLSPCTQTLPSHHCVTESLCHDGCFVWSLDAECSAADGSLSAQRSTVKTQAWVDKRQDMIWSNKKPKEVSHTVWMWKAQSKHTVDSISELSNHCTSRSVSLSSGPALSSQIAFYPKRHGVTQQPSRTNSYLRAGS